MKSKGYKTRLRKERFSKIKVFIDFIPASDPWALYKNRERGFGGGAPESDRRGQQNASAFASGGPAVPLKAPLLYST